MSNRIIRAEATHGEISLERVVDAPQFALRIGERFEYLNESELSALAEAAHSARIELRRDRPEGEPARR